MMDIYFFMFLCLTLIVLAILMVNLLMGIKLTNLKPNQKLPWPKNFDKPQGSFILFVRGIYSNFGISLGFSPI